MGGQEGGRRSGDSRGRGQQKDRVGVLHRPNALPLDSHWRPPPGLMPRPESRQMLPTLLSSILLWHLVLLSLRRPSWGALCDKPKGDTAFSLPPSHPRKARTYRPLPASGCAPTALLDSDRAAGQSGASPAPTPLAPWGCLDQSCRRLTAGGSSSRTRMTWRSSVPRSPGGELGRGEDREQSGLSRPSPQGVPRRSGLSHIPLPRPSIPQPWTGSQRGSPGTVGGLAPGPPQDQR